MAGKSRAEELADIHTELKAEFEDSWSRTRVECQQSLKDRKFLIETGGHYEGQLADQYENKPKIQMDKCRMAQRRISSEYRKNPITVDFVAKDGSDASKTASALDGLYRADEQRSNGGQVYKCAFDEASIGGKGGYRFTWEYEDEYDPDDDRQRICIKWVPDADISMFWDPNSLEQDKSDAKWGGILHQFTRKAYKEEFGDDPVSWPRDCRTDLFDWENKDYVYVFEAYRVEESSEDQVVFEDLFGNEEKYSRKQLEEDPKLSEELEATGKRLVREKTVKRKVVRKYVMSGSKVLDDAGEVPGAVIPLVPEYGERYVVDGVERFNGIMRTLRDPQRLYDMIHSWLAMAVQMTPVEVPVFDPEQIPPKLADMWADSHLTNPKYLLAKALRNADGSIAHLGPHSTTKPPSIPQTVVALMQSLGLDMKEMLGNPEAGEEVVSNISGKAVELIQDRIDLQSFLYIDNAREARRRGGEIWLAMASELYAEDGRVMKTVGREGEIGQIEIGRIVEENGKATREYDFTKAQFDVYADSGPASSSKKAATVRELINAKNASSEDPETVQILNAMIMMNLEGEGIEDLQPYYRMKLLRMGIGDPTEEERKRLEAEAEGAPPNANDEYLMSEAKKNEATIHKIGADTLATLAKTEETKAKAAATYEEIDRGKREQLIGLIDRRASSQPELKQAEMTGS